MTKENWDRELKEKYTTTRTRPDGNARRKIDYITINAKYRNATRKAQRNIYRNANTNQHRHRRVQVMQLYYNAARKYRQPIPPERGGGLKYDIVEIRLRPEKLTK